MAILRGVAGKYAANTLRDQLGDAPLVDALQIEKWGILSSHYVMAQAKDVGNDVLVHRILGKDHEDQLTRIAYAASHFERENKTTMVRVKSTSADWGVVVTDMPKGTAFPEHLFTFGAMKRAELAQDYLNWLMEFADLTVHHDPFGPLFWIKRWRRLIGEMPDGSLKEAAQGAVDCLPNFVDHIMGQRVRKSYMPQIDPVEYAFATDDGIVSAYVGPLEEMPLMHAVADYLTRLTLIAPNRRRQFVWGVAEMYWGATANSGRLSHFESKFLLPFFTAGSWIDRAANVDELNGDQAAILKRGLKDFTSHSEAAFNP